MFQVSLFYRHCRVKCRSLAKFAVKPHSPAHSLQNHLNRIQAHPRTIGIGFYGIIRSVKSVKKPYPGLLRYADPEILHADDAFFSLYIHFYYYIIFLAVCRVADGIRE